MGETAVTNPMTPGIDGGFASFYEEHIFGGMTAAEHPTKNNNTRLSRKIDPIVRNLRSAGQNDVPSRLSSTPEPMRLLRVGSPNLRKSYKHASLENLKSRSVSDRRSTRANVFDEDLEEELSEAYNENPLLWNEVSEVVRHRPERLARALRKTNEYELFSKKTASGRGRSAEGTGQRGQYRTTLYVMPRQQKDRTSELSPIAQRATENVSIHRLPRLDIAEMSAHRAGSFIEITKEPMQAEGPGSDLDSEDSAFQSPERHAEGKPYYQIMPCPKQMEINPVLNGLRNMGIVPVQTPPPLLLRRTDYNQVVVDIKPRDLPESDKQQHVSQWIQIGTVGDSLDLPTPRDGDSHSEDTDSNPEVDPLGYAEMVDDGDAFSRLERIAINRGDSEVDRIDILNPAERERNEYPQDPTNRYKHKVLSNTSGTIHTASMINGTKLGVIDYTDSFSGRLHEGVLSPVVIQQMEKISIERENQSPVGRVTDGNAQTEENTSPHGEPISSNSIISNGSKLPPATAPKPRPQEQLLATHYSRQNTQNNLRDEPPPPPYGTFPRLKTNKTDANRRQKDSLKQPYPYDNHSEKSSPYVKNMAAYFTELIRQQSASVTPTGLDPHQSGVHVNSMMWTRATPPPTGPEERGRGNQKSVDVLRKRSGGATSSDRTTKAVLYGSPLDEYDQYRRPSSAPRISTGSVSMDVSPDGAIKRRM